MFPYNIDMVILLIKSFGLTHSLFFFNQYSLFVIVRALLLFPTTLSPCPSVHLSVPPIGRQVRGELNQHEHPSRRGGT